MPIKVACKCGQAFAAQDQLAGKAVKCPKCGQGLRVPAALAGNAAAPQPAPATSPAMTSLLEEAGVKAHVADHRRRCPNCDTPMMDQAVLCVICGFNTQTTKFVKGFSRKDEDAAKYAAILGGTVEEGHGSAVVSVLKKAEVAIVDDKREQKAAYRQGTPLGMLVITLSFIGSACICMTLMPKGKALNLTGWVSVVASSAVGLATWFVLVRRAFEEKSKEWLLCLLPPYCLYFAFTRRDSRQEGVVLATAVLAVVSGVALAQWAATIEDTPSPDKKAAHDRSPSAVVAVAPALPGRFAERWSAATVVSRSVVL